MPIVRTAFVPDIHGFRFANRFLFISVNQLFSSRLPFSLKLLGLRSFDQATAAWWYGLAPGMCLAALDYFLSGRPVPAEANTVQLADTMVAYIQSRLDGRSFRQMQAEARRWMDYDARGLTRQLQDQELPNLCRLIEQGQPVPLLLVHARKGEDPSKNSAALAYAFQIHPAKGQMEIHLYHPNYPGRVVRILLAGSQGGQQIEMSLSSGEPLYGFFAIDYKSHKPPALKYETGELAQSGVDQFWGRLPGSGNGIWSDHAIGKETEDRFGYHTYASVLAERAVKADTPLTIGVFGPWGSGKTSLMRLIHTALPQETLQGGKICPIWIDTWALGSQEEVWQAFLQALFNEVRRRLSTWQRLDKKKLVRQLLVNSYRVVLTVTPVIVGTLLADPEADWTSVLKLAVRPLASLSSTADKAPAALGVSLTYLLGLWTLVKPAIEKGRQVVEFDLKQTLKFASFSAQISELMKLQKTFSELVQAAVGKSGRLVVFIDDLDRCAPDKIPEVLEAIKLFATSPACVYVLGLDHEIVQAGIRKKYRFQSRQEAAAYLEKIIQVPFFLPPLDRERIKIFIREDYPELQETCPKVEEVFSVGLEANPRQVKRALNIYRTLVQLSHERFMSWEIDSLENELIAKMVVIQSRFREYYAQLVKRPKALLEAEASALEGKLADPELQSLLQAGGQRFTAQDQSHQVNSYIFLISTAQGSAEQVRPGSLERQVLLGGEKEKIKAMADEILSRAGGDPAKERSIRQAYVDRLEKTLWDVIHYTWDERLSAWGALIQIERWHHRVAEFPTGRERQVEMARILRRGAYDEELAQIGSKYCQRIYEALISQAIFPDERLSIVEDIYRARDLAYGWSQTDFEPQTVVFNPYRNEFVARIGRYPVTNRQYQAFVHATHYKPPEYWIGAQYPQGKADHPVVWVSLEDAHEYCRWLSRKTGRVYTIPTEPVWVNAAQGKEGRPYPWGTAWDPKRSNWAGTGKGDTTPVGQFSPEGDSLCGAADMVGNVWEWTLAGVLCGGAFDSPLEQACISASCHEKTDYTAANLGFRVEVSV